MQNQLSILDLAPTSVQLLCAQAFWFQATNSERVHGINFRKLLMPRFFGCARSHALVDAMNRLVLPLQVHDQG